MRCAAACREKSARRDDVRVWRQSEKYAAFGPVSDSRAPNESPKALRAEGYTENVLWRSLNVMRGCYPGPDVVTVSGVIPITVIEIMFALYTLTHTQTELRISLTQETGLSLKLTES